MRRSRDRVKRNDIQLTPPMTPGTMNRSAASIGTIECDDGYLLRYRIWPTTGEPVAALFLVNGMMSHSGWFGELASALSGSQFKVIGADRRGSGLNKSDRGNAPSRHVLLSDFRKVIEAEDCGVPMYLVGWCWGAVLVINAALEFGGAFSGVVLLTPGLFPSEEIDRAIRSNATQMQQSCDDSSLLTSPLTEDMFTPIHEFREFIAGDELAIRAFTPQFVRVSQQMLLVATSRLAQLTLPVLLLLAGNDRAVNNVRTLNAFQRLPAGRVTSATLPFHHGMQFEAPREIASLITRWLGSQSLRGSDYKL